MPTGRQASVGGVVDQYGAANPVRSYQRRGEHRLLDAGGRVCAWRVGLNPTGGWYVTRLIKGRPMCDKA